MKITVLGSGTSNGIPMAGCGCAVCQSEDSRDKRYRASIMAEGANGELIVIDTPPEFRLQALRAGIKKIDALFYTHSHADHLHGADDVRPFSMKKALEVYGNRQTISTIKSRFDYIFKKTQAGGGKPRLNLNVVKKSPVCIGALKVRPVPVKHGTLDVLGWRIDEENAASFVYITDVKYIPPESIEAARGAGVMLLGAIRARPHSTHFSFDEAYEAASKTGVPKVYFTHISHEHSHAEIEAYCENFNRNGAVFAPAYDGLKFTL